MCSVVCSVHAWSRFGWLLLLLLGACNSAHVQTSTETGNPPVIDASKISLVVSSDSVRIVGKPGAITPGGADVELAIVGSSQVESGPSNPDGSFDIALDASDSAVIEVRAEDGDKQSPSVYVTRGGATVGSGQNSQLSCMQRTSLASQAIGNALTKADTSCITAADCKQVSNKTVCTDSCSDALVSSSAVAAIQSAVMSIDEGLCADFAADGCKVIAQPCVPPLNGPIACRAGKCVQVESPTQTCPSCLDKELRWGSTNNQRTSKISGCDDYSLVSDLGTAECTGTVPHCARGVSPTLEDVIVALAQPDVQQALMDGGIVGGPPAPGGLSTMVALGDQSFVISNCGTGSACQAIPQGVLALRQLLQSLPDVIQCEQPSCPPNARYVEDVCLSCGPGGGCSEKAARCAVVCSDPSPCTGMGNNEISCSPRGICEANGCI
ncbi:MAG TPA: hypothetical protein VJV78_42690 [Polyangiales bacterium]|nr:hypothetical protein [Polyangiales bacterium]